MTHARALLLGQRAGLLALAASCAAPVPAPSPAVVPRPVSSPKAAAALPPNQRDLQISVGDSAVCTVRASGQVFCHGCDNDTALLGHPNFVGPTYGAVCQSWTAPAAIAGIQDAVQVDVGATHACAVLADGGVVCWGWDGSNGMGLLGGGAQQVNEQCPRREMGGYCSSKPVIVSGLRDVVEVTAGSGHTCARTRVGQVFCWGQNHAGQLGDGTTENRTTPVRVVFLNDAVEIDAGDSHTCARLKSGAVVCWGSAGAGQLGNARGLRSCPPESGVTDQPKSIACSTRPVTVDVRDAVSLASGHAATCAVLKGGTAACWGNLPGDDGEHREPFELPRLDHVRQIALGAWHACALTSLTPAVVCWRKPKSPYAEMNPQIPALDMPESIRTSNLRTCALDHNGLTRCW